MIIFHLLCSPVRNLAADPQVLGPCVARVSCLLRVLVARGGQSGSGKRGRAVGLLSVLASKRRRHGQPPRRPSQLRAPYRYNRPVRDLEFVQRVRRHTPASLVPLVARYGAAFADKEHYLHRDRALFAPWVLAEVARARLVYGTDFNRTIATEDDLRSCCAAYLALSDPELGRRAEGAVARFLLRVAGEQPAFQQEVFNDLSRPVAPWQQTHAAQAPGGRGSGLA